LLGTPIAAQGQCLDTKKGRKMRYLAIAASAVLGGALLGIGLRAAEPKSTPHHHMTPEMEACMKECAKCAKECASCLNHCINLVADGKKEHVQTVRTCNDCGDMCAMAGKLIARDGAFADVMCDACAKACDGCGKECAKFPHDEHMTKCAQACKDCANACREMIRADAAQ
jgi:hypothetical protein